MHYHTSMSRYCLRLFEDRFDPHSPHVYLPSAARALYVREGGLQVEKADSARHVAGGAAWLGDGALALATLADGCTVWRWELLGEARSSSGHVANAPSARSVEKLAATVELDEAQEWLMRLDRVAFPPGGVALTHVHQGPGIRCVLHGEITIMVNGGAEPRRAGEAWLELGHEPVLAPTTDSGSTSFIRCMLLPRACKGRSSIRYVRPEDRAKPKPQDYLIFGERFVTLPVVG